MGTRRDHGSLLVIVLALLSALSPPATTAARGALEVTPAATQPNIVVITTDDLNLSTLADGLANGWMPNLKAGIIDQGVTFSNSFVVDSVCSPSRASFLTGQHSHNHGVLNNVYPTGGVTLLDDSSTLATWLKSAGYHTGFMARYINGYGTNLLSSPKDDPTYIPPGWDEWQAIFNGTMFSFQLNDNGTVRTETTYETDYIAAQAAAFIAESEANDAQPFFLWVTTVAPHEGKPVCSTNHGMLGLQEPAPRHAGLAGSLALPTPPSFNEVKVEDKPTWLKSGYPTLTTAHIDCITLEHRGRVETMMAVDDLIGTVIAALDADGETADTLIVFTSDNGFGMGEHRVTQKQHAFEEAIRVPLYVRVPGSVTPQVAQQLVVNTDLAPTMVELAQATAGITMDGRSLVPILQDPSFAPWRTGFLVEHTPPPTGVITEYKALRDVRYVWVEYVSADRELYDLATDPDQLTSQHANPAYKNTKLALRQRLNPLRTCVGVGCWQ